MRYSILVKFLVVLVTACSLVAAVGGAAGIVEMESASLYVNGIEVLQGQEYDSIAKAIAAGTSGRYAAQNFSNLSYAMRESLFPDPRDRGDADHWRVRLQEGDNLLLDPGQIDGFSVVKEFTLVPVYPIISVYGPDDRLPDSTGPTEEPQNPSAYEIMVPEGYLYHRSDTQWEGVSLTTYHYYYYEAPEYTVTVYMRPEVLESSSLHLLTNLFPYRYAFIAVLALGLLLFAAGLVYLVWAAGRTPDRQLRPGGLNRLPLDLYALGCGGGIFGLWMLLDYLLAWMEYEGPHPGNLSIIAVNLLAIALLALGFLCCLCAQVKIKGFWWQHSFLGWLCHWLGLGFGKLFRSIANLWSLLPVIWKWLLASAIALSGILITALLAAKGLWLPLGLVAAAVVGLVCYNAWAYGSVLSAARHMAQGDLEHKISTRYLVGAFRECGEHLNELAEVATDAARKQMRSERMRTELITNVSHDIKTPLTSIINYVDLLGRPHTPEEGRQYLEVLGRQSQRMKKLIEDLMEMSRATSGAMAVDIRQMDAGETVLQALGEFSDKLEGAQLESVFQHPDQPVTMLADGRLAWRVLSNLLSNAVKYAMPGTRLYVDLVKLEDRVLISLKNVSRQPLNVSADELTERFVRGDAARNTEGSGLGLNIAKSLMELQKGQLHLLIDGDLFKVTLIFPAGEPRQAGRYDLQG